MRVQGRPVHAIEQRTESGTALGIGRTDPFDPAEEVRGEVAFDPPALRLGTETCCVPEGRSKLVVLRARDVATLVDDKAEHALTTSPTHDRRLVIADPEAFRQGDRADGIAHRADTAEESSPAGQEEIVGVARVLSTEAGRERSDAAIE